MPRIVHGTLVAATMTTVNLDGDFANIEVLNRNGAAEIFFTVDGVDPTVGGADTYILPAAIVALQVPAPLLDKAPPIQTVVKMISSGVPTYTVRGT